MNPRNRNIWDELITAECPGNPTSIFPIAIDNENVIVFFHNNKTISVCIPLYQNSLQGLYWSLHKTHLMLDCERCMIWLDYLFYTRETLLVRFCLRSRALFHLISRIINFLKLYFLLLSLFSHSELGLFHRAYNDQCGNGLRTNKLVNTSIIPLKSVY